jgi:hypothetical protein
MRSEAEAECVGSSPVPCSARTILGPAVGEVFVPDAAEGVVFPQRTNGSRNGVPGLAHRPTQAELAVQTDVGYGSVRIYTVRAPESIDRHTIGVGLAKTGRVCQHRCAPADLSRCITGGLLQNRLTKA